MESIKLEAGEAQKPVVLDILGVPHVALPPNFTLENLADLLPRPERITERFSTPVVDSFCAYINAFKTDDTIIMAEHQRASIVAHIDYHATAPEMEGEPDGASKNTHKAIFTGVHSKEWQFWTGQDKKSMDQMTFGVFLEDNIKDILDPEGAAMVAMVLSISKTSNAEFQSSVRLSDGQVQFHYVEKDGKKGEMKLPEKMKIAIPVFERGGRYAMTAKLRMRLNSQHLTFWYELERPDLVRDAAYDEIVQEVIKQTDIGVLYGAI